MAPKDLEVPVPVHHHVPVLSKVSKAVEVPVKETIEKVIEVPVVNQVDIPQVELGKKPEIGGILEIGYRWDFEIFFLKLKLNTWDFGEFFVEDEMNMVGNSRINQRTVWFIP